MRYSAIVRAVYSSVWAILPEKLEAISDFVQMKMEGHSAAPEVIAAIRAQNEVAASRAANMSRAGGTAIGVIPVFGLLLHRSSPLADVSGPGCASYTDISQQLRKFVADPNVKSIVMVFDSPGGEVAGCDELAAEIYDARKQKKITAIADSLCASAAFYLASQSSEVVVSPSSRIGSIGVYMKHLDISKALEAEGIKQTIIKFGENKTNGDSGEPLSDSARTEFQELVNAAGEMFEKAVARGRRVSQSMVHDKFGQGLMFDAKTAVRLSLADRVATFDEVLAKYDVKPSSSASARASALAEERRSTVSGELIAAGVDLKGNNTYTFKAEDSECSCECESCQAGDCSTCTHEACEAEAEGCVGCPIDASAIKPSTDTSAQARADAEARERRLRLARV